MAGDGWPMAAGSPSFARRRNLRGAGQVMFQDNPLTGVLFLVAIVWGAFAAGTPAVVVGAVLALVVGTARRCCSGRREHAAPGPVRLQRVLVGAAVPTFLGDRPSMWVLLVLGAAVSTVVMLAIGNVMKTWDAPALTFPFVLTTWFLLLAAYFRPVPSPDPCRRPRSRRPSGPTPPVGVDAGVAARRLAQGRAQVFLIDNWVSGVLVVIGTCGRLALGGGLRWRLGASRCSSRSRSAPTATTSARPLGFSPVLTAIAVGCVFYCPSVRVALYALLAIVFTVIVQGAMDAA